MRHETAGVTEILLDNAKNEFLEYGFHEASLRRIATKSGVSTNSIYSRFHDKTGLFSAIVKEAADGLMEIYLSSVNEAKETFKDAIDYKVYKYTIKEDIARTKKMGVPNLPSLYINGKLKFKSIIPSREELEAAIKEVM